MRSKDINDLTLLEVTLYDLFKYYFGLTVWSNFGITFTRVAGTTASKFSERSFLYTLNKTSQTPCLPQLYLNLLSKWPFIEIVPKNLHGGIIFYGKSKCEVSFTLRATWNFYADSLRPWIFEESVTDLRRHHHYNRRFQREHWAGNDGWNYRNRYIFLFGGGGGTGLPNWQRKLKN